MIDKHFGNLSHKPRKICNISNFKISCSCMPNMKSIISNYNKTILEDVATEDKLCNCRDTSNCPMNGRSNVKPIVYNSNAARTPPPSTATDVSMKQPANNVASQLLSQTAANATTNTTGSRKKKANKSKIMNYIGSCETTFKARFRNRTHLFRNRI